MVGQRLAIGEHQKAAIVAAGYLRRLGVSGFIDRYTVSQFKGDV